MSPLFMGMEPYRTQRIQALTIFSSFFIPRSPGAPIMLLT